MTTTATLRDGSVSQSVRLDRLIEFDDRSKEYPVRSLSLPAAIKTKTWELPRRRFVNQGEEGACVSAGFGHDSASEPYQTSQLHMEWLRTNVYWVAQGMKNNLMPVDWQGDPWPGGAYPGATPFYEGTSVLTGAKVMQSYGFFENYHWAFSIDDLVRAVIGAGTVVLGLWWTEGQMYPEPNGLMKYEGNKLGGHCVCCRGIWVPNRSGYISRIPGKPYVGEPVAVIPQSWGLDYGNRGEVYMPLSELEKALKDQGECCVPVNRKKVDIRRMNLNG